MTGGGSRNVPFQRVGFLRRFGVNRVIDFDQFGLESPVSILFDKGKLQTTDY